MTRNAVMKWVALALVGLLIAGGVAVLGSNLASRQIGLSSEPLRAGDALAPPTPNRTAGEKAAGPKGHRSAPEPQPANPEGPAVPAESQEPVAPPVESPVPAGPPETGSDRHDGEGGDD